MSNAVHILAYAGVVIFLGAVLYRIVKYIKTPIHVRWELYPVAHEAGERAEYGGSYLEDVNWWKKERKGSMANELKVMIPEILLLIAAWGPCAGGGEPCPADLDCDGGVSVTDFLVLLARWGL